MTELNFKGKEFVYNHHLSVPHRPLIADAAKSVGKPDLSGNLIIEGDNLHALKSLLPMYAGKVDCIFIDPPYNTGNEGWCYNDRVNAPMIKEWLSSNPVGVDDSLRHDKWCAMMWPRLKLLHDLLADHGVIFICIDDNELHHLRNIMTEIFGEDSFIGVLKRRAARKAANLAKKKAKHMCDYVVAYCKDELLSPIGIVGLSDGTRPALQNNNKVSTRTIKKGSEAKCPDGKYEAGTQIDKSVKFEFKNSFEIKDGLLLNDVEVTGPFRINQDMVSETAYITKNLGIRRFVTPEETDKVKVISDLVDNNSFYNEKAFEMLRSIFQGKEAEKFETPKPVDMVSFFIRNFESDNEDKDFIYLDSFAGSGTTAHAVHALNKEDGGNRRVIMVEMEDYANSITAERMRRVIAGIPNAKEESLKTALGGSFTYCNLGDPIDLDAILKGENLPTYKDIAPLLFHMATSKTLDPTSIREEDFYVGATDREHVWMFYKPELDWLKTDEAALTLSRAKEIAGKNPDKHNLVFAPARFVSEKVLRSEKLKVAFVPFPDALYRVVRDKISGEKS